MKECVTPHCTTAIGPGNKSGFCRACTGLRLAEARLARAKKCACGKALTYGARKDTCRACLDAEIDSRIRHCKTCNKQIDPRARSNFCYAHRRNMSRANVAKPGIRPIPPYKMADLFAAASMVTQMPVELLKAKGRTLPCIAVRQAVWHLSKGYFSYTAIGRMSGGRDHSTVINGCQRAEERIATEKPFRMLVDAIHRETLRAKEAERARIAGLVERIAA